MSNTTPAPLAGRAVLVTGATSGLGRAIAVGASMAGARVALIGRRQAQLSDVLAELHGDGHMMRVFDVSNVDEIPAFVREVSESMGGLHGLVHAAGVHSTVPVRALSESHISDVMNTNVSSALMMAKGFRQRGVHSPGASLVLMSSAVGLVGQAGVSTYSASKGAIVALTKSLALELAREDIRVNCLCPGVVMTPMTVKLKATIGEEAFKEVEDAHPLGLGEPEDVAGPAVFILSGAARWITGTAISVDGGYTAR